MAFGSKIEPCYLIAIDKNDLSSPMSSCLILALGRTLILNLARFPVVQAADACLAEGR